MNRFLDKIFESKYWFFVPLTTAVLILGVVALPIILSSSRDKAAQQTVSARTASQYNQSRQAAASETSYYTEQGTNTGYGDIAERPKGQYQLGESFVFKGFQLSLRKNGSELTLEAKNISGAKNTLQSYDIRGKSAAQSSENDLFPTPFSIELKADEQKTVTLSFPEPPAALEFFSVLGVSATIPLK